MFKKKNKQVDVEENLEEIPGKKLTLKERERLRREKELHDAAVAEATKEGRKDATEEEIKEIAKKKAIRPKKERFETINMWMYYIAATFNKDRGTIPDNIGNRILITSNMYITKLYLNSIILVTALGMKTPITLIQEMMNYLRESGCKAVLDYTFKRQKMMLAANDSGLKSRMVTWGNVMHLDGIPDRQKEITARCLYTANMLKNGTPLFYTRMYITIRAKTGTDLKMAEKKVGEYLTAIGGSYLPITSSVKETLEYCTIISDRFSPEVRDVKALVTSNMTLAQMMPNSSAYNGDKGLYTGVNILNNTHFNLNLDDITIARNIYLLAPSGVGKTVLALNMAESALEHPNWRVCAMDIKGNEWTRMCKACDGVILALTPKSRQYINSFKMDANAVGYDESDTYFYDNLDLSKQSMITLTGAADLDTISEMETILDRFLNSMYTQLGVLANNKNTWGKSMHLTPFDVYDMLTSYMTPTMFKKFPLGGEKLINALRPYMTKGGSKSYVFAEEFNMLSIMKAKMVVFNFGMLNFSEISMIDGPLFDLKFMYMQRINSAYVQYNYNNHFETLKIMEESQIVPPKTLRKYVEEFTLRRAQRQSTLLLGNSIQALIDSNIAKPLIENTRALFIGDLPADAREQCIKQFDLEQYRDLIMLVGSNEKYSNSFAFINRMEAEPVVPIIKLILTPHKKYLQFTPTADLSGNE